MSQNSQDAIDVLSKVIVDTIEKKLNDAKFDKSQTGVVTAVSGNTYTISVFGSQYNITSDQIYTVGQSVVVTALQGDMKRLVCSPDNIGTMKTVDSKVNVVGSQLSIIDTDFADTIVKYTDVSEFLTLKDQADGQLSLWFYSGVPSTDTAPTVNWVTEDAKRVHIGDLYYDMKADDAYRWTDTFIWETLSDKNLLKVLRAASLETDTANGSRRVFFTKPSTPYNRGDVWASSSGDNKVLVCQTARPITESFSRTDWAVALKYTDDTKANEALDAAGKIDGDLVSFKTEYNSDLESTKQQIEARVTTKKYNEDMSGLNTKISLAESRISKNENAIILCATKTEAQKYADAAELNANKKLEEHIKTATESIDSKVAKTDYTGKNIATLINQSTNTVKIKATKLNLTGAISIDKNGKVALDSTSVNNSLTQVSGDKITTDTITVDKLKAGQIFQLLWKNDSKDAYSAVGEENKLTFEADSDYSGYIFIFRGYKEREVVEIDPESAATKRVLEYLSKVSVIVSKPVAGEWSGAEYHCVTMNTPKLCMIYDLSAGDNSTPSVSYNSDTNIKSAFRPFYVKAYEKNWLNQATDGAFTYKFNALTGKYEKEQRDPQVRYYPKQIYNPYENSYIAIGRWK